MTHACETQTAQPQGTAPATRIKLCGIRRRSDATAVNGAHPDYAGFVFAPESRRFVRDQEAADLRHLIDPSIPTVGVFVDDALEHIVRLVEAGTVQIVQLHGAEDEAYLAALRQALPGIELWKAFTVRNTEDLANAARNSADKILLDNGKGTGKTFVWDLMGSLSEGPAGKPVILAGGLTPDNLGAAIERFRPFAVDLSSGVETDGVKDAEKMIAAVQAARATITNEGAGKRAATGKEPTMPNRFGIHGGQYIPETLMNAVIELEDAYNRYKDDPAFNAELKELFDNYAGRPSHLYFARKMTEDLGGAKIYLKREDMNHTGAHKINNVLGQALLAQKMGKTRLIAETGAGQHGVATATAAALFGMECVVFMGEEDTKRQALNVYKMKLLGSDVVPVTTGTGTLKDAVSEAMREWTSRIDDTHYCLGSVMGPHPFPTIVRDFQAVISKEIKQQMLEAEGKLPDAVIACVGGGSNAIGSFYHFIDDENVRLIGCEAAGRGVDTFKTAATIATGKLGIFHGMKSYFCQDEFGQIAPVYSISAGLDYPGIGPEHAHLHDIGRAEYAPITDDEAVQAFEYLSKTEGIIPAIESAHALAHAMKIAPSMSKNQTIVVTLSGRGDKDCAAIARYRGEEIFE